MEVPRTICLAGLVLVTLICLVDAENKPTLSLPFATLDVPEDRLVDSLLMTCTMSDPNDPNTPEGNVWSRIVGGNSGRRFSITASTCELYLLNPLDYENTKQFNIDIQARDQPGEFDQKTLTINVLDVNDNAPTCDSYVIFGSLSETATAGTSIAKFTCDDEDTLAEGSTVQYTVRNDAGTNFDKIEVDSTTGEAKLKSTVDFDTEGSSFFVKVNIHDNGSPSLTSTGTVYLYVTDADDQKPSFAAATYNPTVAESAGVGTTIVTVVANDADELNNPNSKVTYGFQSTPTPDLITIDQTTGDIIVKKPLDRETAPTINAVVYAYSGTDTTNTVTANVAITVTDVNDQWPKFTTNYYQGNVNENAATNDPVLKADGSPLSVVAIDNDAGLDGTIDYSITTTGTPFQIDTSTGAITVSTPPDYETNTAYLIEVVATDRGTPPLSSTAHVQISINPVNEATPVFAAPNTFTVKEDAVPGTALGATFPTLTVTDADAGVDGELIFSMVDPTSAPFSVDSDTGNIRVATALDYETATSYTFVVRATDKSATTAKSAEQSITVTVTNEDDEPPTCTPVGTQVIQDPLTIGNIVATLDCTDPDDAAATFTYTLTVNPPTPTVFGMTDNRVVMNAVPTVNKYEMSIVADDSSATTTVSFIVVTETQMTLTLTPNTISFEEGKVGKLPVAITWGGVFEYTELAIISGKVDEKTVLFSTSGEIACVSPYDYETTPQYKFTIRATSRYGQEAEQELTVNVIDVNDNSPQFPFGLYVLPVVEDLSNQVLGTYTATDADAGAFGTIKYSITFGNDEAKFAIDADSGALSLVGSPLSYSTTPSYTLIIRAEDGGTPTPRSGTTTVLVNVVQADTTPPTIVFVPNPAVTTVSIEETEPLGSKISQVSASDTDTGMVFTYSFFSGNVDDDFLIDGVSGIVYVQHLLDRERTASYTLVIRATDQNLDVAETTLTVTVTDVNDNYPMFTPDVFEMYVDHGAGSAVSVGDLTVSDADDPATGNGQFDVTIVEATLPLNQFKLTGLTRLTVETNDDMDFELNPLILFQVQAVDKGTPARSSTALVAVHVKPAVDTPKFDPALATVTVTEGIEPGTQIYDLDATVLGASESDSTMLYSITSSTPANDFAVMSDTGQVIVANALDYETSQSYTIDLKACYAAQCATNTATFVLTVNVVNENDNTPIFAQEAYTASVDETASLNTPVRTIVATDADINNFNTITYTLTGTSTDFAVSATGQIYVNGALDYTVKNYYNYILIARDNGSPAKSAQTAVIINIIDVNDHDPVFVSGTTTSVIDSAKVGAEIFHFHATDVDTGTAGTLTYGILTDSSGGTKFAVNPTSGILTTTALLDALITSTYTVETEVRDGGPNPRSATSTLSITLVSTVPNNFNPVFTPSTATAPLARTASIGTTVYTALATDADTGAAGVVTHSILSGNTDGFFLIDSSTGVITTATSVLLADDTYTLVIQAVDDGLPQKSSTLTLTVAISPLATISTTYDYTFSVAENSPTSTEVGRIDVDPDRTVTAYSIAEGGFGAFTITADGLGVGVITTAANLDYEAFNKYSLLVKVTTDIGVIDKFVQIDVTDTNDEAPCFSSSTLALTIAEGMPVGTTITTVSYTDKDTLAANRDNTLELKTPGNTLFSLDSTGNLVLTSSPDFETLASLSFEILVKENNAPLRTCTLGVDVTILDLSETEDVYLSDITTDALLNFEFPCQSSPGDVIYTLLPQDFGIDPPAGSTAEFIYYFSKGPVNIDSSTGTITVSNHPLACHEKYIRWVTCRVSSAGAVVESKVSLLRFDTFDWTNEMIVLTFGETEADVRSNLAVFKKRAQRLFAANQRFGTAQMIQSSTTARRRLLATSTAVYGYGVANTEADRIENINMDKTFMTEAELLALMQGNTDGSPLFGLSDTTFLTLNSIEPFQESTSDDSTFFETPAGIAVIVLICLFLVGVIAITVFCIYYQRKQNEIEARLLASN